ncbi:MAG: hypothetical protein KF802_06245 [Bdellovibrionaceae bacterium]|nr:hypothetical protein [Pseudobdellovibrionaceae bacterium]
MKTSRKITILLLAGALSSCGGSNYFEPMASKNSDEALYEDALKLVDGQRYDEALAKIAEMSSAAQGGDDVVLTKAGIYAGKCGLNFLTFVDNIDGSGTPFNLFKSGFTGVSVDVAHCQTAQDLIETFGTTGIQRLSRLGSLRGNNANTFMAVLGMSKIGAQLKAKEDDDPAYNACSDLTVGTDSEVAQIGTGFALLLDNFAAISANLSGSTSTLLDDLNDSCQLMTPNPCSITSPADTAWTDPMVQLAIKALVRSDTVGVQNCSADPMHPFHPFDCCP